MERLFLLDGMALAYRAYFSFINRPLVNSRGENTSAIFGFVNTLMKILNEDKPDHIAVVFDTKEPTFRHKMYGPYKATREKMPEDMSSQLDKLKEVVRAFNLPSLEKPGFEADDIMGTLARKAEKQNILTMLVTGDKDFMQLISPLIKIYKPGKGGDDWEIVDEKGVKAKFGVKPDQVTDVLGLTGDKSDNVPGVPGIGEKTAIPLIQKYRSIENLLENIDNVEQKGVRAKINEHRDKALLSKVLVTIDCQVELDIDIHQLRAKEIQKERLIQLFTELEFKGLAKKISSVVGPSEPAFVTAPAEPELASLAGSPHSYHLIGNEKELAKLAKLLSQSKLFAFDTETTSKDPLSAELVGISISVKPGEAWYIPVASNPSALEEAGQLSEDLVPAPGGQGGLFSGAPQQSKKETDGRGKEQQGSSLTLSSIKKQLSGIFADRSIGKIGQNIKYDMLVLSSHGIPVDGELFDTMVANYILRPDARHSLDSMASEHLHYKMISYDELTGTGKERKELRDIPVEIVSDYSCEDADFTLRLSDILGKRLSEAKLDSLCRDVEFPLIKTLSEMEKTGIRLDTVFLKELSAELDSTLNTLTRAIHQEAREEFNINSTQQLGKILFDKLKLRTVRKTKTGFSTDVTVLESIKGEHPIVQNLLEYRQLQKLKNTYVDALPALINPGTGKLHTSYNQTVALTGRLSSSDPNLQNIPVRTELGSRMRRAFIPSEKGMLILSADYSQIELRIMAHISEDPGLIDAFINGEDIHSTTASKLFGVSPGEITKEMRRKAKEVNFGIIYGIGPFGLAARLEIRQSEAKEIIDTYFKRFPKVKQYIFDTISSARKTGYVSTLLGRRRFLPEINSRNHSVRSNSERQAINMPIQGTAADMIKVAMIKISSRIRETDQKNKKDSGLIRMLLQVHDELVFEVTKGREKYAEKMVAEEMSAAMPLKVPVTVDVGVGTNWLEAH